MGRAYTEEKLEIKIRFSEPQPGYSYYSCRIVLEISSSDSGERECFSESMKFFL